MLSSRGASTETLDLLHDRLHRVTFALNGKLVESDEEDGVSSQAKGSANARLKALEQTLQAFVASSATASDVLDVQKKCPDLFSSISPSDTPAMLSPATLASLVLAHSQLYHSLSTKLFQLQGTPLPAPASVVSLIDLRPRIEHMQAAQDSQAQEFHELRLRSAKALEAWHENGVLGMAERWAEWEERLRAAEIIVRRREAVRRREDGTV